MTDPLKRLETTYIRARMLSSMGWTMGGIEGEPWAEQIVSSIEDSYKVMGLELPPMPNDRVTWLFRNGLPGESEVYEEFLDCID